MSNWTKPIGEVHSRQLSLWNREGQRALEHAVVLTLNPNSADLIIHLFLSGVSSIFAPKGVFSKLSADLLPFEVPLRELSSVDNNSPSLINLLTTAHEHINKCAIENNDEIKFKLSETSCDQKYKDSIVIIMPHGYGKTLAYELCGQLFSSMLISNNREKYLCSLSDIRLLPICLSTQGDSFGAVQLLQCSFDEVDNLCCLITDSKSDYHNNNEDDDEDIPLNSQSLMNSFRKDTFGLQLSIDPNSLAEVHCAATIATEVLKAIACNIPYTSKAFYCDVGTGYSCTGRIFG